MSKNFNSLIPKVVSLLAQGTDGGNIILMLQNAGFEASFDSYNDAKKSKKDFVHEFFIKEYRNGNIPAFFKLADLITVKEYFRPGEYEYRYSEQDAKNLANEIRQSLQNDPPQKVYSEEERRELFYRIMNFHKGLHAVSKELFIKGHFEQCVFEASKFLENYIQNKINDRTTIGRDLIGKAFGGEDPKLTIYPLPMDKAQKNEQQGFCFLVMGETMFIKNRISHRASGSVIKTKSQCLKIISTISSILETIDSMYSAKTSDEINLDDIPF